MSHYIRGREKNITFQVAVSIFVINIVYIYIWMVHTHNSNDTEVFILIPKHTHVNTISPVQIGIMIRTCIASKYTLSSQ